MKYIFKETRKKKAKGVSRFIISNINSGHLLSMESTRFFQFKNTILL